MFTVLDSLRKKPGSEAVRGPGSKSSRGEGSVPGEASGYTHPASQTQGSSLSFITLMLTLILNAPGKDGG